MIIPILAEGKMKRNYYFGVILTQWIESPGIETIILLASHQLANDDYNHS